MPSKNPRQSSNKGRGEGRRKDPSAGGSDSTKPARLPRYDDRPDVGKPSGSGERGPETPRYGDTEKDDPRRPPEDLESGGGVADPEAEPEREL